jgi:hypothetical protein
MLINKMGVESDDDVVELNSRRVRNDPKNRVTMTMLLQVAMSAVPRSELIATQLTPVTSLHAASTATHAKNSQRTDVA